MAGGGKEATGVGISGRRGAFLCRGPGDLLHDGTGGGEGRARLPRPRRRAVPGDTTIDRVSSRLRGDAAAERHRLSAALRGEDGARLKRTGGSWPRSCPIW